MSGEVARFADVAMFTAVPLTEEGEEVKPRVTVIDMTSNPLRKMTAVSALYNGRVVHDPSEITQEEAMECLAGYEGGKIVAPLEWIQISLLIEGVTRAFTHQMVRQRTATFVQESLRFAVKDNTINEVALPPSLSVLKDDAPARVVEDMAAGADTTAPHQRRSTSGGRSRAPPDQHRYPAPLPDGPPEPSQYGRDAFVFPGPGRMEGRLARDSPGHPRIRPTQ